MSIRIYDSHIQFVFHLFITCLCSQKCCFNSDFFFDCMEINLDQYPLDCIRPSYHAKKRVPSSIKNHRRMNPENRNGLQYNLEQRIVAIIFLLFYNNTICSYYSCSIWKKWNNITEKNSDSLNGNLHTFEYMSITYNFIDTIAYNYYFQKHLWKYNHTHFFPQSTNTL